MLAPSKAIPKGFGPAGKVPSTAPVLARSLVTLLPPKFATQILAPSKATPTGLVPTENCKLAVFAGYQRRIATWSGLGVSAGDAAMAPLGNTVTATKRMVA